MPIAAKNLRVGVTANIRLSQDGNKVPVLLRVFAQHPSLEVFPGTEGLFPVLRASENRVGVISGNEDHLDAIDR